jgi:hypothetical protein
LSKEGLMQSKANVVEMYIQDAPPEKEVSEKKETEVKTSRDENYS